MSKKSLPPGPGGSTLGPPQSTPGCTPWTSNGEGYPVLARASANSWAKQHPLDYYRVLETDYETYSVVYATSGGGLPSGISDLEFVWVLTRKALVIDSPERM